VTDAKWKMKDGKCPGDESLMQANRRAIRWSESIGHLSFVVFHFPYVIFHLSSAMTHHNADTSDPKRL
jgi:hypothetical protein